MEVAHIDAFRRDPERFWRFYGERFAVARATSGPTAPTTRSPSSSARGLLDAVITQNIDRLHARAGTRELVEVHGTIAHSSCLALRRALPARRGRERAGGATRTAFRAATAAQPLKPDVVLFGEFLPADGDGARRAARRAAPTCCCASAPRSRSIRSRSCRRSRSPRAARIAIVTQGPTPLDGQAAVSLDGDVVAELEAVLAALGG